MSTIATTPSHATTSSRGRSRDTHPHNATRHTNRAHRITHARRAAQQLTTETIEQIAQRVAQLIQQHHDSNHAHTAQDKPGLMTATQLAARLGVSRAWIYAHAQKLGAITLGEGPKARLRFDLEIAMQALDAPKPISVQTPTEPRHRRSQRPPHHPVPLLPIKPSNPRRAIRLLSAWGGWRATRPLVQPKESR